MRCRFEKTLSCPCIAPSSWHASRGNGHVDGRRHGNGVDLRAQRPTRPRRFDFLLQNGYFQNILLNNNIIMSVGRKFVIVMNTFVVGCSRLKRCRRHSVITHFMSFNDLLLKMVLMNDGRSSEDEQFFSPPLGFRKVIWSTQKKSVYLCVAYHNNNFKTKITSSLLLLSPFWYINAA